MSGYHEYIGHRVRYAHGETLRLIQDHPTKIGALFSVIGAVLGAPVGAWVGGNIEGAVAGGIAGAIGGPVILYLLLYTAKFFSSSYALYREKESALSAEINRLTIELLKLSHDEPWIGVPIVFERIEDIPGKRIYHFKIPDSLLFDQHVRVTCNRWISGPIHIEFKADLESLVCPSPTKLAGKSFDFVIPLTYYPAQLRIIFETTSPLRIQWIEHAYG